MKKITFLFAFLLFSFAYLNAQNYALFLTPEMNVGSMTSESFSVSNEFDNLLKSIPEVEDNISYFFNNSGIKKVLEVRIIKNNITYLVGFEIGTSVEISAMIAGGGAGGGTTTHTCSGSCSSGITGVLTYCSNCRFLRDGNKSIIGCECATTPGCCIHSISNSVCSSVLQSNLANHINYNFL